MVTYLLIERFIRDRLYITIGENRLVLTEEQRKYQREWARKDRVKNPQKHRDYHKKYREKHREEMNRKAREYNKKYPEKCRERERRYRVKHRKEYNERKTKQIKRKWKEVMDILGDKCMVCGRGNVNRRVSFHEVHGREHKENPWYIFKHIGDFVPLCRFCHKALHRYHQYKEEIEELERKME